MRATSLLLIVLAAGAFEARAQYLPPFAPPNVGEAATKVSSHVWAVYGFPNIGIVVGTKGVLVVDTGLGPAMGRRRRKSRRGWRRTASFT